MPWTLYRYILRELLKILLLTTAVLVTVMSFGAAIRPLQDGLLGPASLIRFVLFTMPTVLGFALPFAGAFASTLVFTRLVADNEVLACSASGMSYKRVLTPALLLGLVLTLAMLVLSNTVIPGFWKSAKRTVEGDVLSILVGQLNQNQPYVFRDEGLVLYAQSARQRPPGEIEMATGIQPEQFIELRGVAFGQYDHASGEVFNDTTASRASALLFRDPVSDRAYVTLRLQDPVFYNARTGERRSDHARVSQIDSDPIYLPNPVDDEAVFFSLRELIRLWNEPDRFDRVRNAKAALRAAILRQAMHESLRSALTAGGPGEGFVVLQGGLRGDHYMISSPVVEDTGDALALRADQGLWITVDRYPSASIAGEPELRFEAVWGSVAVQTSEFTGEPEARVTLRDVRVVDPILQDDAVNQKDEHLFTPMTWDGPLINDAELDAMTAGELGHLSEQPPYASSAEVRQAKGGLAYQIMRLSMRITSQAHTRLASAVACVLLIVLGGIFAIKLRGRLPLVVFFWSFLFALITLLMVYTGQNLAGSLDYQSLRPRRRALGPSAGVGHLCGGGTC